MYEALIRDFLIDRTQESQDQSIPLHLVCGDHFESWLTQQDLFVQNWVHLMKFSGKDGTYCIIPKEDGSAREVFVGSNGPEDFWDLAPLARSLPYGLYKLGEGFSRRTIEHLVLTWGLASYIFDPYKSNEEKKYACLLKPEDFDENLYRLIVAIHHARDLINTPAEDMGPVEMAQEARLLTEKLGGTYQEWVGEELLEAGFQAIYTVGRASLRPPRLVMLYFESPLAQDPGSIPEIALIGKGVCFDTGGLDLKNPKGMRHMKKDMAGAAHALALAGLLVRTVKAHVRVLLPLVDNDIASYAYRPGDVIRMKNMKTTHKKTTVEITNTDAEGRLILADAITKAVQFSPSLMIDFATLTGAQSVALGHEIAGFYTLNDEIAELLMHHGTITQDWVWRMPLHQSYKRFLDSDIADIMNASDVPYAGSITAALFLEHFVPKHIPWVHFDFHAWNAVKKPGRPEGAEVMALRAVFSFLIEKYGRI